MTELSTLLMRIENIGLKILALEHVDDHWRIMVSIENYDPKTAVMISTIDSWELKTKERVTYTDSEGQTKEGLVLCYEDGSKPPQ